MKMLLDKDLKMYFAEFIFKAFSISYYRGIMYWLNIFWQAYRETLKLSFTFCGKLV